MNIESAAGKSVFHGGSDLGNVNLEMLGHVRQVIVDSREMAGDCWYQLVILLRKVQIIGHCIMYYLGTLWGHGSL